MKKTTIVLILFLHAVTATSNAELVWTVGLPGDGWAQDGTEGGPETVFVLESGSMNDLPGDPNSRPDNIDDDYYFAGVYETVLDGGDYEPYGVVEFNEVYAERALLEPFNEPSLRYHFNLPDDLGPGPFTVQWSPHIVDAGFTGAVREEARHGVEVYFNGRLIGPEQLVTWDDFDEEWFDIFDLATPSSDKNFETPSFTLEDVNGKLGEGFDNYVELRHVSYFDEGGGAWLGLDHVALHQQEAGDPFAPLDDGTLADEAARVDYIHNTLNSWIGDSNNDGEFDSGDLIAVFSAGEYEDAVDGNSTYATGDWNGDGDFNTSDLVAAFSDGGYEQGPQPAGATVPEPSSAVLLLIGLLACLQKNALRTRFASPGLFLWCHS